MPPRDRAAIILPSASLCVRTAVDLEVGVRARRPKSLRKQERLALARQPKQKESLRDVDRRPCNKWRIQRTRMTTQHKRFPPGALPKNELILPNKRPMQPRIEI